ncbi:MAG TPA: diphosphate--fructose-6-phosphate 1-phosphotransferase [Anaerolineaceae bacterium]
MEKKGTSQRLGILVGGGPAPGINGVINAVTNQAVQNCIAVTGIYDGFKHLMDGKVQGIELTPQNVSYIHNQGGSILRTARANPTKSEGALENCVTALSEAGINALISIGGDDTAYSASRVARYAQEVMGITLRSVHVPKTIDNDLPLPEDIPTFGFETARELGARLVMNLKRDAVTAQHWFLVLTMGRKAGHLALGIGNSSVATLTLIPEEWGGREIRLQEVVDILVTSILLRLLDGKAYGVALLAEGILENLAREDLQTLENVERDEHGHIRLAEVNFLDILKKELDRDLKQLGVSIRLVKHTLGYELRCAPPSAFDIEYTRTLGEAAVSYLLDGGTNAIITLQHNQIVPIPYGEMIDAETGRTEVRMVDITSYRYRSARKFMARLKPELPGNDALLGRLAALTNLTETDFKRRYGYLVREGQPPF